MKKQKGFTLVELLAVIAILGIIMLIAVVAILPTMRKSKNKALVDEGKTLVKSAEVAYAANQGNMINNDSVCVSMEYLKQNGYYEKGVSDGYEGSVLLTKQNGKLIKKYVIANKDGSIGNSGMVNINDENPTFSSDKPAGISTCLCDQVYSDEDLNGEVISTNGSIASGVNLIAFYNYGYESEDEERPLDDDGVFWDQATEVITRLYEKGDTSLAYDGTSDNNLRYIGANPNNYVSFNGELWRIIGVMNNVDDGNGTKEKRMKIILNSSLGEMKWNLGDTAWQSSSLYNYLNNEYYNSLNNKNLIDKAMYYLGGYSSTTEENNDYVESINASQWYQAERSNKTYSNRQSSYSSFVGLLYPSDYGFAVGGSLRASCLTKALSNYNDCYTEDWLIDTSNSQWTLTKAHDSSSWTVYINSNGYVVDTTSSQDKGVRPVLYLKSNVKITGGAGTSTNPYQLSI